MTTPIVIKLFFAWLFTTLSPSKNELIPKLVLSNNDTIVLTTTPIKLCKAFTNHGLYKSQADLDDNFNSGRIYDPNCVADNLGIVDFNTNDYIFLEKAASGCKTPVVTYSLLKIPRQKKYLLIVNIQEFSSCKPLYVIPISLLCDKLDPTYTFEYQYIKTVVN